VRGQPHVLVVDDSALFLQRIQAALEKTGCRVTTATNGSHGLLALRQQAWSLVVVDVHMPVMDGFALLRTMRALLQPAPVVVLTNDDHVHTELGALELGAIEVMLKPAGTASMDKVARTLAAIAAHVPSTTTSSQVDPLDTPSVVVVLASTGGPRGVRRLLQALPGVPRAPMIIAQHMPRGFTEPFAERLQRICQGNVRELRDGDKLRAGDVRVCPAGQHARLDQDVIRLVDDDGARFVPSFDLLLSSTVAVHGRRTHAIVLSGMGNDGAHGCRLLRRAGGTLWVESSSTAAIDSMPSHARAAFGECPQLAVDVLAAALARCLVQPMRLM
jgi:two-component system, chemotaxis family, protein-glutamate methylesterase/glutaminase